VNLSSDVDDKLKIYRENFEKAYLEATKAFYKLKAPQYLQANGVQNYMRYADAKLKEEEGRARRYLETGWGCTSVSAVCIVYLCFTSTNVLLRTVVLNTQNKYSYFNNTFNKYK
jgi:cullin-5